MFNSTSASRGLPDRLLIFLAALLLSTTAVHAGEAGATPAARSRALSAAVENYLESDPHAAVLRRPAAGTIHSLWATITDRAQVPSLAQRPFLALLLDGDAAARVEDEEPILPPVVVTASRHEEPVFKTPRAVTVVSGEEISERMPRTAAEALRHKPGIWVQKTGHVGGAPILRGFMGNRVIYLFDGIRRNTAGLFGGPNSFLQTIDALDIDRIEVVRGPGSVLYGSDAIGGIVHVISNEEPLFSPTVRVGGRSYGRFGSVDHEQSGRQELFLSSSKLFVFAGGTLRDIDDLRGGRGVGVQSPSSFREGNWDVQVDYLLAKNHRIELFMQDYDRPKELRFDRPDRVSTASRELYGLRYFGKEIGFIDDLQATMYFQNQERSSKKANSNSGSDEEVFGLDVQATSYPTDSLQLVYGVHASTEEIESGDPVKGTQDPSVDWLNLAAFVLSQWQVTDRLRLDFGIRVDVFTLESDAPPFALLATGVQDAINSGSFSLSALELDETDVAVTGGVGAVYSLTKHINLVGHAGRAFRAPNKADMLRFGEFTFGFNVPSGDLDPETSVTVEVGVRAQYPDFAGAILGYYTVLQDAIVSRPGTFGGSTFIDKNGNGVRDSDEDVFVKGNSSDDLTAYGFELEGVYYLPAPWKPAFLGGSVLSVFGNFSWMLGSDKAAGEPLSRLIPVNGLLGVRVENSRDPARRKWWVAFEVWIVSSFDKVPGSRVGRDPAFKLNPQDKNSALLRADGSVPGFVVFNLRGGVHLSDHATLTLAVENLTDKNYRVKDSRIDAPGINFVVALVVRF